MCDDCWTMDNSNVVCRQLGYDRAYQRTDASVFGNVSSEMEIYPNYIRCSGNETSLSQCWSGPRAPGVCHHIENFGVRCCGKIYQWNLHSKIQYSRTLNFIKLNPLQVEQ